jgi:hypothetical protein
MPILHDSAVRSSIENRLAKLTKTTKPAWGKMSVDQMLWHVNQAMDASLGRVHLTQDRAPLPRALIRTIVLYVPWTKNAPTNKGFIPQTAHDFDAELARCRALISEISALPIEQAPAPHPMFGQMTGRQQSHLHAKHLDHHLRQFGV